MPYHEPDPSDPMELLGVGDPAGGDAAYLARCLAEEYLHLGLGAQEVLSLFRSPEYPLAHRAWLELGEVEVFALVSETAQALLRARSRRVPVEGGVRA